MAEMDGRRKRAIAGVAALCCVVLIGASGWWFATSNAGLLGGFFQTVAVEEGTEGTSTPPTEAEDGASGASASEGDAGAEAAAPADAAGEAGAAKGAPAAGGSSGEDAGASAAAGEDSGQAAGAAATVTVRVTVDSSAADGRVSYSGSLTFEEGATVYDALCGTGLAVSSSAYPGMGVYVSAIGGLAEKEFGGESGWKYSVNGSYPDHACDKHVLSDGDVVRWVYVRGA